jgi:hypothetical protein
MTSDLHTLAEQRVDEALTILGAIGIPLTKRTSKMQRRLARVFLAVCNIKPNTPWSEAAIWEDNKGSWAVRSRDVIKYINEHYGEDVSSGSYDDIRRKNLVDLVQCGLVQNAVGKPDADTNDGTRGYAARAEASGVIRKFGDDGWQAEVDAFVEVHGNFADVLVKERQLKGIPVTLPDGTLTALSTGGHNVLQKAIIEEFIPRFCPGGKVLYLGDTSKKILVHDKDALDKLRFFDVAHDTLPDVIVYDVDKNWLLLIEAVHSANPISPMRHLILVRAAADCTAPLVFVSAFQNRATFGRFVKDIAWETEVWLADDPDHMIHFDGTKFLGPY